MYCPPFEDTSRLSLNQYTTHTWNIRQAAEACRRSGLKWIGLWRDKVAETGLSESARIVRDNGLKVSGLCRGGMFPYVDAADRQVRTDDNLRAIDEAAELEAEVLVLVCGGIPGKDIVDARRMVEDGIAQILPYAEEREVKLGIEPLHPMFAADRSVVSTLGQALDMAERLKHDGLGVVIDVYHVWWDPDLYKQIKRSAGRIFGFHVDDWLVPAPDMLMGRGIMGDGVIELRRIRAAVDQAGYQGPIECEIFNQDIWDSPGDEIISLICQRYLEYC